MEHAHHYGRVRSRGLSVDKFYIKSDIEFGEVMETDYTDDIVKNEPMFFSCSSMFADEEGGPITRDFLSKIDCAHDDLIIDTRVHMLMPGWFPCIPGYHHDDVPRSDPNGQPNYDDPEYRCHHAMALVNGDICPTEFALGTFIMPRVEPGEIVYKIWHPEVEEQLDNGIGYREKALSNQIIYFDDRTFHQGTRAVKAGWRWFGRATWGSGREIKNEIRRQVQVYLEYPMEGW